MIIIKPVRLTSAGKILCPKINITAQKLSQKEILLQLARYSYVRNISLGIQISTPLALVVSSDNRKLSHFHLSTVCWFHFHQDGVGRRSFLPENYRLRVHLFPNLALIPLCSVQMSVRTPRITGNEWLRMAEERDWRWERPNMREEEDVQQWTRVGLDEMSVRSRLIVVVDHNKTISQ